MLWLPAHCQAHVCKMACSCQHECLQYSTEWSQIRSVCRSGFTNSWGPQIAVLAKRKQGFQDIPSEMLATTESRKTFHQKCSLQQAAALLSVGNACNMKLQTFLQKCMQQKVQKFPSPARQKDKAFHHKTCSVHGGSRHTGSASARASSARLDMPHNKQEHECEAHRQQALKAVKWEEKAFMNARFGKLASICRCFAPVIALPAVVKMRQISCESFDNAQWCQQRKPQGAACMLCSATPHFFCISIWQRRNRRENTTKDITFFFFRFFFKGYKQNTQIMFGKNEWSMLSLRMDCPSQRALAKMIEINDSVHGTETSNRKKKCGTRISRRECTSASTVRYNHAFRCMRQRQRKRSWVASRCSSYYYSSTFRQVLYRQHKSTTCTIALFNVFTF